MKAKLISISSVLFLIILIAGCKKNSSGPKISLSLKSVNATTFAANDVVKFTFEFTPKTNLSDTLFIVRKFYTCPFISRDTSNFKFPDFETSNQKGELIYSFTYGQLGFNGCYNLSNGFSRTDSLNFYFWVKDKDGNVSDTVVSPKIILLKQP